MNIFGHIVNQKGEGFTVLHSFLKEFRFCMLNLQGVLDKYCKNIIPMSKSYLGEHMDQL